MSSGQRKRHDGFNKSIMRDGVIVILRKNGTEKVRLDPKTKEIIKAGKLWQVQHGNAKKVKILKVV